MTHADHVLPFRPDAADLILDRLRAFAASEVEPESVDTFALGYLIGIVYEHDDALAHVMFAVAQLP